MSMSLLINKKRYRFMEERFEVINPRHLEVEEHSIKITHE